MFLSKKKKWEIALGAAFVSCINETIRSVHSGFHQSGFHHEGLNRDVVVKTRGFQLRAHDLNVLNTAAKIALNEALDVVSHNDDEKKEEIVSGLWPGAGSIPVTFSLTPEKKFVWSIETT